MPDSKDGQKRITSLELNYVAMQLELKNLGAKIDEVCKKIDGIATSMGEWRIEGHDNSRDIAALKLELAKMQLHDETTRKNLDKLSDSYRSIRSYIAGGIAVITVVVSIIMYLIDKFVK